MPFSAWNTNRLCGECKRLIYGRWQGDWCCTIKGVGIVWPDSPACAQDFIQRPATERPTGVKQLRLF